MALIVLLFYFFPIYTIFFIVYILITIIRKKKVPWIFVGIEVACIVLFFYLEKLVDDHTLIFTGEYADGSKNWGSGMANAYLSITNLFILVLIFLGMQLIFWSFFSHNYKKLNRTVNE